MRNARSKTVVLLALLLVGAAGSAAARPRPRLDIPEQSLEGALRRLAHDDQVEVLFDYDQIAGLRSRRVSGDLSAEQALRTMLAGARLEARRTATGGYVIVRSTEALSRMVRIPAATEPQTTVAEILVAGQRTQNVDIRRSINDIQPYKVLGSEQILDTQSDDLEDLLRQRLTSNSALRSLSQAPVISFGSNRSQVDIRGMGVGQTLILLDGRRLPATPSYQAFGQPDLNGLPAIAIDRIETLSSTAGGIYGAGATGGVVNIVLKRNYSGGEMETGGGLTQRGDAPQWRAGVVLGGSWFDDRLHLFASVAGEHNSGLAFGDRNFVQRARSARYANGTLNLPVSVSWNLLMQGDGVYDTKWMSTAPLSVAPGSVAGAASFLANAGTIDTSLSDDGQGRLQSLLTSSTSGSVILSGRLELSERLQVFADVLALQNTGTATGPRLDTSGGVASNLPDEALFPREVSLSFPTPGWSATYANRSRTFRGSVGAILRLGRTWSAEADATVGRAQIRTRQPSSGVLIDIVELSALDPAQGYQAIEAALAPYADLPSNTATSSDQMTDASLRAGGAMGRTWAGPLTVTALVEARRDQMPHLATAEIANDYTSIYGVPTPKRTARESTAEGETVYSAYGELRAPLTIRDASPWLLRGLEAQMAVREDRYRYQIPVDPETFGVPKLSSRGATTSITLGLKAWPLDGLMLRGSYATGYVAPSLADMTPVRELVLSGLGDPRRGNEPLGDYYEEDGGSPAVRSNQARSLTAGAVFQTDVVGNLRLSLDFTHLTKTREVSHFFDADAAYVLAHEAQYPTRVTRAPLTDADRAEGFTVGAVTRIDTTTGNEGRSVSDTVEISLDHQIVTSSGTIQSFAEVFWTPKFRRRTNPANDAFDARRALDGPLALRSLFGTRWSRKGWAIGIDAQAYGGSRVSYADPDPLLIWTYYSAFNVRANGRDKVPPQVYFDGDLAYRSQNSAGAQVIYRLGVRNLLDKAPPSVFIPLGPATLTDGRWSDAGLGYSTLGDPRGRRFVASIELRF